MIYSVSGKIVHIEANLAVVECGGVGYACRTTANTLSSLRVGENVRLLTYLHVREDNVELFGFFENAELSAFKMLISVSGVGPKAALAILSDLSPQGFALCIAGGDSKLLTKSPGIGPKIAQRIVLELKDKVEKQLSFTAEEYQFATQNAQVLTGNHAEAVSALVVLGFSNVDATKALSGLPSDMSTSDMIKAALKRLS